jgi:hypothetical protein
LTNVSKAKKRQSSAGDGFSAEVGNGDWYDIVKKAYHDGQPQITAHRNVEEGVGAEGEREAGPRQGQGQGCLEKQEQIQEQDAIPDFRDSKAEFAPFDAIDVDFPPIQTTVNPSKLKE